MDICGSMDLYEYGSLWVSMVRYKSILDLFGPQLSHRQKLELEAMKQVWFFTLDKVDKPRGGNNTDSSDDDNNNYIPVRKEQLHYRYEVQKMIGEGGQGLVLQCLDHKTKTLVAVKMLSLPWSSSTAARQRTELEVANELQGKASDERYGVIRVLDTFQFRGHNCLVVELLKKSLYDVMSKGSIGRIYVRRLREHTRAILDFLLYAKGRGIVHADIKPDNILLTATGKVRVTDFGCSFYLKHKTKNVGGTLPYMAPELLLGYDVTSAVDMWGLGCTLAEMATGKVLFDSPAIEEHLPCCIEILGMPPKKMVDDAPKRILFFDSEGLPKNMSKQRPPGSLPLHRALQGHHPQLVDFVSRCLHWADTTRWATTTISSSGGGTTPVQGSAAAQPRAEPEEKLLSPSSLSSLTQTFGERTEVVEVVETQEEDDDNEEEDKEEKEEEEEEGERDRGVLARVGRALRSLRSLLSRLLLCGGRPTAE
ncbi:dual specificity tyrosine-phosphorylation-regulated kinase 4-like [Callorhinchus milii]|uniref:dual specificity tyrosine-phosphorylation-regulated kinase 4-like n=1 Tax=Callorhinchus milii TaxID=7868 RepID=UPI001C3FCDBB|nr:dual specificity tyrosine-phosphorylation-regulated kinase 4-like [Callorhinchus milii]